MHGRLRFTHIDCYRLVSPIQRGLTEMKDICIEKADKLKHRNAAIIDDHNICLTHHHHHQ